jgi:pimeloyl-ACP methyl ester carboxylesterase
MAELDASGRAVQVGDVVLRTPGLGGTASVRRPTESRVRGADESWEELDEALDRQDARAEREVVIDRPTESRAPPASTLRTSRGEPALELTVPAPPPDSEQVVLLRDEAGVFTWHFADTPAGTRSASPAEGMRTYTLRSRVAEAPTEKTHRGPLGALGKKVIKVIALKVADAALGKVGEWLAGKWEDKHRPYRARTFTAADYTDGTGTEVDGEGLRRLGGGRALLLVHGTFSRANAGFGRLPPEFVERLATHYENRVFALDHPTLSQTPVQNVDWLLSRLPADGKLDVDVICHSRGGLVARALAERPSAQARINVYKLIFVATPNAGTVLADFDHLGDLIDSYTNLLHFFPDVGVTDTLETVLTVVKTIAVGSLKGLDGLRAMQPGGDFLTELNAPGDVDAAYHALAANFEPKQQGFKDWAVDQLMDPIFKAGNDLVVPTDGVWSDNGGTRFPIDSREVFETKAGVAHTAFFAEPRTQDAIAGWLQV